MTSSQSPARRLALWAGPLVGLLVIVLAKTGTTPPGLEPKAFATLGVTFWVALWWVAECMPIGATSLLPVLLLPASGVMSSGAVAGTYMDRFILLMMAGFMAALAIERSGLHRRIALAVLLRIGASPRRLVLGMLVATGFISMWIANTAATLIMLPIGLALLARLEPDMPDRDLFQRFSAALVLAIGYAASVGGMGTPLGTPPNLIYLGAVNKAFGTGPGFLEWMGFALPIVILMTAFLYFYFVRVGRLPRDIQGAGHEVLLSEKAALGPMSRDELRVALIFGLMVLLWVTRQLDLGQGRRIGWAPLLGLDETVDDATVAVLGTTLLFVWPSQTPGERLLDWATAKRIPWDVVLLFGGGLALAKAFEVSGLSKEIAAALGGLEGLPVVVMMFVLALTVAFLSEITSNTAIATLLMPILAPFAKASGLGPEVVMLPAALAASCGFMLPVATPPNAVVYGTGRIPVAFMVRTGFWLNIAGVFAVTLVLWVSSQL
jgi:sodium-dependent dicarboxylate transporter 2/3/5